jgi:hypothetical protein
MATDPALIREVTEPGQVVVRVGFEGDLQEAVGLAASASQTVKPAVAAIIFPVIAASGFWVSGVAVLAVLAVGAGHVALNQIPTISASGRQRMLGEQRGDDPERMFTDRSCDRGGRSWIRGRIR